MMLGRVSDAGTPIFDEKHYVPEAWAVWESWEGGTSALIGGVADNPAYGLVVHPPLAKQLMALGMGIFGYTPLGWRIAVAACAVAVICLIAAIARRISGSDFIGAIAGVLALCDGILFVTGRSGMLDHVQTLFICIAAYCLVRDTHDVDRRWSQAWHRGDLALAEPVRTGTRWWRFGAGIALGCAVAVKWSGLYYMAFAGIIIVALDYSRRRRYTRPAPNSASVPRWRTAQHTLLFDASTSFWALVIVPAIVYVVSWRAWFAAETSVYRHAVSSGHFTKELAGWRWSFLPEAWQNFIFYHRSVMEFHTTLTNSQGNHHDWESKPWAWLVSARSLLYYSPDSDDGMKNVITLIGTPAIWWVSVPVLLWGLWCLIIHRDRRWVVPVLGFAAGFLPWLAVIDRQMYSFYAVNLAPFLVIAIAMTLGQLARIRQPQPQVQPAWADEWGVEPISPTPAKSKNSLQGRLSLGMWIVLGYLTFVMWNFLYFWPLYTGVTISEHEYLMRMWLPSWK